MFKTWKFLIHCGFTPSISVDWPKYGLPIDANKGSYIMHVGIYYCKTIIVYANKFNFDFYLLPYSIVTWRRNIPATILYNINVNKEGEGSTYLLLSMSCILLWIYFLLLDLLKELKSSFISVIGQMLYDSYASPGIDTCYVCNALMTLILRP